MESFTNKHRYLIQFMLTHGAVSSDDALSFLQTLNSEQIVSMAYLQSLIIDINREISKQSFKISPAICEITGRKMIVWLNLKNDDLSRLQSGFSPLELEYFHVIMQEILSSDGYFIPCLRCINIASTLTSNMSKEKGEKVLGKWIKGGYFVNMDGNIFLGIRTILEFTSYLKTHVDNCICNLCSELVISGQICGSCDKNFHSHCIEKFLQKQHTCPCCKQEWKEQEAVNTQIDTEAELSQDSD